MGTEGVVASTVAVGSTVVEDFTVVAGEGLMVAAVVEAIAEA